MPAPPFVHRPTNQGAPLPCHYDVQNKKKKRLVLLAWLGSLLLVSSNDELKQRGHSQMERANGRNSGILFIISKQRATCHVVPCTDVAANELWPEFVRSDLL
jgi:hypothetical protein